MSSKQELTIDVDQIESDQVENGAVDDQDDPNHLREIKDLIAEKIAQSENSGEQPKLFKIIIIGETGIGKSCILKRLTTDAFTSDHDVTIGVDFASYMVRVEDTEFKLQIWDTAGQESFRSITKIFFRSADAVILGYSITQRDTFDRLSHWLQEVEQQCDPDAITFLVGNKADLEQERVVSFEQAQAFQKEHGIKYLCETSAKSGDNVYKLFMDASKFLYQQFMQQEEQEAQSMSSFTAGASNYSNSVSSNNAPGNNQAHGEPKVATFGGQGLPDQQFKLQKQGEGGPTSTKSEPKKKKNCKC